jgi:hypothetical protein
MGRHVFDQHRTRDCGDRKTIAGSDGASLATTEIARTEPVPDAWWASVFAEKPVKFTTLFASMLMFGLKAFHVL